MFLWDHHARFSIKSSILLSVLPKFEVKMQDFPNVHIIGEGAMQTKIKAKYEFFYCLNCILVLRVSHEDFIEWNNIAD